MNDMLAERFWRKHAVGSDAECWLWLGCKNGDGYGSMLMILAARREGTPVAGVHVATVYRVIAGQSWTHAAKEAPSES